MNLQIPKKSNEKVKANINEKCEAESQNTNIYSSSNMFKRYTFPNVYKAACMASITCFTTKKYISFCKQNNEFNTSFKSYLDFYRFY